MGVVLIELLPIAFLIGAIAVFGGLTAFMHANPVHLARVLRAAGGLGLLLLAAFLSLRGLFHAAIPLAGIALVLLRRVWTPRPGWPGNPGSAPTISTVRTPHLLMTLDLETGAMAGQVLDGVHAGRHLETLALTELVALWQHFQTGDPESAQLIGAYLERMHPQWQAQSAHDHGGDGAADGGMRAASSGGMTAAEALEILGLEEGASTEQIHAAWRDLMKRNHPDQGGSTYLAAKINQAKVALLGR